MAQKGQEVTVQKVEHVKYVAMVHAGGDDGCGLHGIRDITLAKTIVSRMGGHGNVQTMLRCVAASHYPKELLLHLMKERASSTSGLLEFIREFEQVYPELDFDEDPYDDVYAQYWRLRIGERISRRDFKRAWELVKKSPQGFTDTVSIPPVPVAVSVELVLDLYEALCTMTKMERIDEQSTASMAAPTRDERKGYAEADLKRHPGLEFAHAIGGVTPSKITVLGRKVIAMQRHFNTLRRSKQKKQLIEKVFA
jgi:hypothetical protein